MNLQSILNKKGDGMLSYLVFECSRCGHQYKIEWSRIIGLYPEGLGLGGSDGYGIFECPNCKVIKCGKVIQDILGHRLDDDSKQC